MSFVYTADASPIAALSLLLAGIPSSVYALAVYAFTAWSLYTIAQRRGLYHAWLAWVPVVNIWILGSLSDQYRYIVHGQVKSKRKWLVGISIITAILSAVTTVWAIAAAVMSFGTSHDPWRSILGISAAAILMGILTLVRAVLRTMALYDLYKSLDPDNAVLFTALSFLFSPTEPFFLFFNREKDLGMPPRKQEYAPEPEYADYRYDMPEEF